jgi:spore coat polysaccharide biosynthesis protein SpsF
MNRVVAIIQARTGSTRLPRKIFADIGGDTMLGRTVRRTTRAATVQEVAIATTDRPDDLAVVAEAERLGVRVTCGSEADVLDRYRQAARAFDADAVVRITSDCPLMDPAVIDLVVGEFLGHAGVDYCSNVLHRTFPRGLDVEVIRRDVLMRAAADARLPHQREHVTPYVLEHPALFALRSVALAEDFSTYRWTVDEPDDLAFVREVYHRLAPDDQFGWRDVVALLSAQPSMARINEHVRQKTSSH